MAAGLDHIMQTLDARFCKTLREGLTPLPPAPPRLSESDSRPTTARLSITSGRAVRQFLLFLHLGRLETRLASLVRALALYVPSVRKLEESAQKLVTLRERAAKAWGQDPSAATMNLRTSMKERMEKEAVIIRSKEREIERTREEMEETIVELVILSREENR